jgi:hypothetical protein
MRKMRAPDADGNIAVSAGWFQGLMERVERLAGDQQKDSQASTRVGEAEADLASAQAAASQARVEKAMSAGQVTADILDIRSYVTVLTDATDTPSGPTA